jgi:GAF domain-containing protein
MFSIIEGEMIRPVGDDDDEESGEEYYLKGRNIVSRAVRTGEAQLVPDAREALTLEPSHRREQVRSEIAAPVKMVGGIIGVIHIARVNPIPFTEEDQKLVEIIADRLALALERIVRSKIDFKTGMSLKDFL